MNIPPRNDFDLLYLRMDELNKRMDELNKKLDVSNVLVDTLIKELREKEQ